MSKSSRQLPGSACDECRNRKLRCDRQRPQCGTCSDAGIVCKMNINRVRRGPKKGMLKALRSRVVSLESRLYSQQGDIQRPPEQHNDHNDHEQSDNSSSDEYLSSKPQSENELPSPKRSRPHSKAPATSGSTPTFTGTFLTELMRADLDHLYFERVHPIVPILQKARYYSWTKGATTSLPRQCLQYAMWTMAMSLSAQFEGMRDILYSETRQKLEKLDLCEKSMQDVDIEQAQAWILVTCYEFLRTNYRRGWISSGRVFRLVQLLKLHELENRFNGIGSETSSHSCTATEEMRRTFWVAYCLDRFVSVWNGWPLTLNEEVVCTCLPSLDAEFLSGHLPTQIFYLSEAIASTENICFSPLAECAILVTICGRAQIHKQASKVEQALDTVSQDFWVRHDWLHCMLTKRMESFSSNHNPSSILEDPMLMFTFMGFQATLIYLCKIMESLEPLEQFEAARREYQDRALAAAREIARCSRELSHMGYFKAHVFTPIPIYLGAERLMAHRTLRRSYMNAAEKKMLDAELHSCLELLRKLRTVNNMANFHLEQLESMGLTTN